MLAGAELLDRYRGLLKGQSLSTHWFGYGTALFLELGSLVPSTRRDGSPGSLRGEYGVMIQFDWRIETDQAVLVGSADEQALKTSVLTDLTGERIHDLSVYGPPHELVVHFAGGRRVRSFMTAAGEPEWTIFVRGGDADAECWLSVEDGRLVERFPSSASAPGSDIRSD